MKEFGLEGAYPLQELYNIVYKCWPLLTVCTNIG